MNKKFNFHYFYKNNLRLFKRFNFIKPQELLGLDLRSLALFRIALGLLIILDLINRAQDLKAHYTESGVFRLAALTNEFSDRWFWSLHFINSSVIFQGILFLIAGLFALALLIGYRTRLVTIISWLFLISLQNRNSMILSAADAELLLLLFWGIFLPLGAYYSVDHALNSSTKILPIKIFSGATIALILQICFIYWFAAFLKMGSEPWEQGFAVYNSLSADYIITPLGAFLRNFPNLLMVFTFVTVWLELLAPFLLFIPLKNSFFRYLAAFLFISLHLSFAMVFRLGLFPLIGVTAWLALLPSELWDYLSNKFKNPQSQQVIIYYDHQDKSSQKLLCLLRTFFVLSEIPLIPIPNNSATLQLLHSDNSWMVVNQEKNQYYGSKAIIYLARFSPFSKILVPLLKWYPLQWIGRKFFKDNRFIHTFVTPKLKFCPIKVESSWLLNCISLFLIFVVLLWNIRSLNPSKIELPKPIKEIVYALNLTQKWDMFSKPTNSTEWYVIPGQLKDGTKIDVFRDGKPIKWQKPDLKSAAFKNMRWRKYLTRLDGDKYEKHRLYYGKYLCRRWNSQHQGNQQLETFKIYYLSQKTNANGQSSKIKRNLLWEHTCFK
ncbi:HTTM domain protein [Rippkaea orientalis PCC 8801]|uniref:HTTM domain protein n=1 Tax=Rippkaea orientalis (strain PCC 8801 / RF-1) TaxID=41431 RepID=B7K056_RIPO1|nr:HTTM domain-containing protein [Rippkaea orientalis]ACK66203.1 HTTM domain protein [Rippkaea orientalis PCC 8801]